jgi:two-component system nitrate/nitrite response regulator NarL
MMRDAVRTLLDAEPEFDVIGEVGDAEACLFQIAHARPDVVTLDLNMPGKGGFKVLEDLQRQDSKVRVYVLSMYSGPEFVSRARELGARGFVAKEDVGQEFLTMLRSTTPNFLMSSSAGTSSSGEGCFVAPNQTKPKEFIEQLTHSEKKVLRLLANSKSSAEIGEDLGVSIRTIHTHRQNIRQKLNLKGANALLIFALENRNNILATNF